MTEEHRDAIATAARFCEQELILADIYEKNGNWAEAANHFERAESESAFAFEVASWS